MVITREIEHNESYLLDDDAGVGHILIAFTREVEDGSTGLNFQIRYGD